MAANITPIDTTGVSFSHTGDTSEVVALAILISANTFPTNGVLDINGLITRNTTGINSFVTGKIRLGTTNTDLTGPVLVSQNMSGTVLSDPISTKLYAANATNAQISYSNNSQAALNSTSMDFTNDVYVIFSFKCNNASDTVYLSAAGVVQYNS